MVNSNIEDRGVEGRGEFSDLISEAAINGLLARKVQISASPLRPFCIGQRDMPAEYLLSSCVVLPNAFQDRLQLSGVCCQLGASRLMDLEDSTRGNLSVSRSHESNRRDRLDSPAVVQSYCNRSGSEEVVESNAIVNTSTGGLKHEMNMPYSGIGGDAKCIEYSLDGGLVNGVAKYTKNVRWQRGGLGSHWVKLSQLGQ